MADRTRELVDKIEALLRRKYSNTGEEAQRRLFDSHDKNADGSIDSDELSGLLKEAGVGNAITRGAWVRGVIKHMDEDGNATISWDEYRDAIRKG